LDQREFFGSSAVSAPISATHRDRHDGQFRVVLVLNSGARWRSHPESATAGNIRSGLQNFSMAKRPTDVPPTVVEDDQKSESLRNNQVFGARNSS